MRLFVAVLVLAVAPAGARAATTLLPRDAVQAGPVLAGARVAWVEPGRVVVSGLDGKRTEIPMAGSFFSLRASAARVAAVSFPRDGDARLFAGPILGPVTPLVSCSRAVESPLAVALDGDALAYSVPGCGDASRPGAVDVDDLSAPGPPVTIAQPPSSQIQQLQLAGGMLGVLRTYGPDARREIVVLEVPSGDERLRADLGALDETPSFAMQADGAVVWCERERLRWASPASPAPKEIPAARCSGVEIAGFGGGRVVYLATAGAAPSRRLASVDLAGAVTTVATGGDQTLGDADSDGRRVAILRRGCLSSEITVVRIGERALRGPACPVRVGPVARSGARRLSVRFACRDGCSGAAKIALWAGRVEILGDAPLRLARGRSRTLRFVLHERARRLLARYSRVTVYVDTPVTSSSRSQRMRRFHIRGSGSTPLPPGEPRIVEFPIEG